MTMSGSRRNTLCQLVYVAVKRNYYEGLRHKELDNKNKNEIKASMALKKELLQKRKAKCFRQMRKIKKTAWRDR